MTQPDASSPALPILVGIVEDEPDVRRRFEDAVRAHPRLSWQFSASTVAEAISLTAQRPADVYLVDLGLPDRDGRDFMRWLVHQYPEALAMVVTVFADEEHVLSSFEAGAMGYLLKDTPGSEIAERIVEMHAGGSPISASVARSVIRRFARTTAPAAMGTPEQNPLSARELEVLRLIEKGMTYDEVAQVLEISWHTVTAHLRRVYRKLQVGSRGEAVFEARQRGLI
ncbi:MAG: response regulator transcription factor [Hydrogenophaga sp.]|uniref:LuxR C-terminal-related transcriptional regulator n=1 Tax=Hydrogenophaga sp. TaxID=1904254 RepID=UPI001D85E4E7|nr:response regulator transcription factor [Hydrogenophaga sp.]MBX3610467.1 response regulator transcription factor [Hydrogenophaga sp.]